MTAIENAVSLHKTGEQATFRSARIRWNDNRHLGRSSGYRITLLTAPSQARLLSGNCGVRPRIQRRDRDGFSPSSLFFRKPLIHGHPSRRSILPNACCFATQQSRPQGKRRASRHKKQLNRLGRGYRDTSSISATEAAPIPNGELAATRDLFAENRGHIPIVDLPEPIDLLNVFQSQRLQCAITTTIEQTQFINT